MFCYGNQCIITKCCKLQGVLRAALTGYVAAGNAEDAGSRKAADYLCAVQRPDGDWEEEHFTGAGFPTDFMIRYHLSRITFPLLALGRLRERLSG